MFTNGRARFLSSRCVLFVYAVRVQHQKRFLWGQLQNLAPRGIPMTQLFESMTSLPREVYPSPGHINFTFCCTSSFPIKLEGGGETETHNDAISQCLWAFSKCGITRRTNHKLMNPGSSRNWGLTTGAYTDAPNRTPNLGTRSVRNFYYPPPKRT